MTNVNEDSRLKRDTLTASARGSRAAEDRQVTERRDLTDEDRLAMFRMQLHNDALPDLPEISGYHLCWLTTTNPRDPIHRRMQLGYEPVKATEVPGMEYASVKTGEYAGIVGVNEMLAFKLPTALYEGYMRINHHDAPLREEQKLAEVSDAMRDQAERAGGRLEEDEGIEDMRGHAPRAPKSW